MSEFLTTYPRRINIVKGLQDFIRNEEILLDHLSIAVKMRRKEEVIRALFEEGFRKVQFENRKPFQIGKGFSKKLKSPWELHLRLLNLQKGMIAIQAEVEISRKYIQHIRSVRSPVIVRPAPECRSTNATRSANASRKALRASSAPVVGSRLVTMCSAVREGFSPSTHSA